MRLELSAPIGILDEHPEWSARLCAELQLRRLPFEKIDHSNHAFDPHDRARRYSVIVNRTSPSSHRRGHGSVLFYAEPLLAHWQALGVPVINPVAAWRFEKSKALQLSLFERLGVGYPRTIVVNHRDQLLKASESVRFPAVVKPNVGGSGALIERFETRAELQARAPALDFGPDGVALLQEYIEPADGAIVRVEVLDGRYLYAIRIVRTGSDFNLCPADICQTPAAATPRLAPPSNHLTAHLVAEAAPRLAPRGACPADATPGLSVTRHEVPREIVAQVLTLVRAASIDVAGVEYLVGRADGHVYFYDINATSNFVANAPAVLGFDPTPRFADYIVSVATKKGDDR
jgi:ribosomal protein S6-L-glutamate ligase RimK-like protein